MRCTVHVAVVSNGARYMLSGKRWSAIWPPTGQLYKSPTSSAWDLPRHRCSLWVEFGRRRAQHWPPGRRVSGACYRRQPSRTPSGSHPRASCTASDCTCLHGRRVHALGLVRINNVSRSPPHLFFIFLFLSFFLLLPFRRYQNPLHFSIATDISSVRQ